MASEDAFIAYAEQDEGVAENLVERLKNFGIECYRGQLFGGLEMTHALQGIQSSRCAVLLLSKAYVSGEQIHTIEKNLALLKSKISGIQSTIAVNIDIAPDHPNYPKGVLSMIHLTYDEDLNSPFWQDLAQAIQSPRKLEDLLGAGDVAHGLANNYFYGFLKIIAKELPGRMHKWQDEVVHEPDIEVVEKVFVVIPASCTVKRSFEENDPENIRCVKDADIPLEVHRAGQVDREYRLHVYLVTDPDSLTKYYVPMIANSSVDHLLKMHEKKDHSTYWLTQEQMMRQRCMMERRIQHLVQGAKMENIVIVQFDDSKEKLSELIVKRIR